MALSTGSGARTRTLATTLQTGGAEATETVPRAFMAIASRTTINGSADCSALQAHFFVDGRFARNAWMGINNVKNKGNALVTRRLQQRKQLVLPHRSGKMIYWKHPWEEIIELHSGNSPTLDPKLATIQKNFDWKVILLCVSACTPRCPRDPTCPS
ncbi:hypothetical protein DFJ73DRAFT_590431 [Zopfochytrium polystomum]|nr:hypothetical protein DFJ73DRAFT_590431 [Zopfochytrium polystomum]